MRVAIGMSGGVDSSVAAALLLQKGLQPVGVTLKLFCPAGKEDLNSSDAAQVCERLGIDHTNIDMKSDFEKRVMDSFVSEYINGRTPNPCIECNRHIKFGKMLLEADNLGCEKIATGHYARIEKIGDKYYLKKAKDTTKDQTYVLYFLTQEKLSRLLLPLGDYSKTEIREIAQDLGFVNANKADSQDICFVPDGDYAAFIERRTGKNFPNGYYVDIGGAVLGQHKGIIKYTIGQRKGLGIALGHPAFVISKDVSSNTVVLGNEENLFYNKVLVKNATSLLDENLDGVKASAKLRYSQKAETCTIHRLSESDVVLEFDSPQRAPSPGQSAVFYSGDIVLGGGTIEKGI